MNRLVATIRGRDRFEHGLSRSSTRPGARSAFKLRGVEGWRGVACLSVLAYHVWQNMDPDRDGLGPIGSTAALVGVLSVDLLVDLFFVLSGLLLFLPFAHAALDDDRRVPQWREFLWRRCLRLLPVYLLLVLVCWSVRNYGVGTAEWKDLLLHLTLLQSLDSETIFTTIGPAWTLSVEWLFYLSLAVAAPPFVRWVRSPARPAGSGRTTPTTARRLARLVTPLLVVALLSALYKVNVQLVWQIPVTDWAWRFGPAAKADDFALGMMLAVAMVALGHRRLPVSVCLATTLAGGGLLWLARARFDEADQLVTILRHPIAAAGWCLVLLAVMACTSDRPARWIDNALFVRLSIVAFCVYLVHEPIILTLRWMGLLEPAGSSYLTNLALVTALTLVAAWVVHRCVEEPWVDLGALQARGGGRRDLYDHLRTDADAQMITARMSAWSAFSARSVQQPEAVPTALREQVLAGAGHGRPVVVATAARQAAEVPGSSS